MANVSTKRTVSASDGCASKRAASSLKRPQNFSAPICSGPCAIKSFLISLVEEVMVWRLFAMRASTYKVQLVSIPLLKLALSLWLFWYFHVDVALNSSRLLYFHYVRYCRNKCSFLICYQTNELVSIQVSRSRATFGLFSSFGQLFHCPVDH